MTENITDIPKIGLCSFSDGRKRVHDSLKPGIKKHQDNLAVLLKTLGAEPVVADEIVYTPRMAVKAAKKLIASDVAGVVFNVPVFAFPNFSAVAARLLNRPLAVLSPGESNLPGMGGMLAAGGALEQMGMLHSRIWGPYESEEVKQKLAVFIKAAGASHVLCGQTYGQIGGRSIGMMTGVSSSPAEWLRVFGVDIDHVDQSEIIRRAELVDDSEKERIVSWFEGSLKEVMYKEGNKLTRENLMFQAACAASVKQIIEEREFDFIGIKCHFDMSEYYCTQCLSAAFLPSYLDWDGPRKPVVCACEADGDGALSMQILQLLSNTPALFLDLRHYDTDNSRWTLCNCGGQAVHYSKRSENPEENLKDVKLVPVIQKYGGVGAHVQYIGDPGEMTFARIMHDEEKPSLIAFKGTALKAEEAWVQQSCPQWPHIFAEIDADPEMILQNLHANHIHAVEGDVVGELEQFADIVGIPFIGI